MTIEDPSLLSRGLELQPERRTAVFKTRRGGIELPVSPLACTSSHSLVSTDILRPGLKFMSHIARQDEAAKEASVLAGRASLGMREIPLLLYVPHS